MTESPQIQTEKWRVEIWRSDRRFPGWEARLYRQGFAEGSWSDIQVCYTRWGAKIAGRHMLATRKKVETLYP